MQQNGYKKFKCQRGFGLPQFLVVVFSISIIVVGALPRIISSRRLSQFAEMQKQVSSSMNEARQEAISQKSSIIYRYDNINKLIVIYNGSFGALGDARNRVIDFSSFGFESGEIAYGRPNWMKNASLADTSNMTELTENSIEITFQSNGAVTDSTHNPKDYALFFYHKRHAVDTAFAVSISDATGNIKAWKYSKNINDYVEKRQ
jgi:Tfp pilus assembly protein FimT